MIRIFLATMALAATTACRSDHHIRCQGWCEAHGYSVSAYVDEVAHPWDALKCWCGINVPPTATTIPAEAPMAPTAPRGTDT